MSLFYDFPKPSHKGPFVLHTDEDCFPRGMIENSGDRSVTMFRFPARHVISQFYHCNKAQHDDMATVEEWVNYWAATGNDDLSLRENRWKEMRKQHEIDKPGKRAVVGPQTKDDKYHCYNPINMQAHRLVCEDVSPFNRISGSSSASLAKALKTLESMSFVGIAELYEESICIIRTKVFGDVPPGCDCREPDHSMLELHRVDHATNAKHDITPEVRKTLDAFTRTDARLYVEAYAFFLGEVEAIFEAYGISVLCSARREEFERTFLAELLNGGALVQIPQ
jgi:hypothetical protein